MRNGEAGGVGSDGSVCGEEDWVSRSMASRSRECRKRIAWERRSGVGRLITPRVRWRVPTGRWAEGGMRS